VVLEAGLRPVERRVLRHEVLHGLRTRIVEGEIAPGTRLLEIPLATRLGVSRGPIREALRQLEQEGLVEFEPHRGAVVVGVPDDEIETMYGIRALLEATAFARASRRIKPKDLEALDAIVEAMIVASEDADIERVTELDLEFHGRVVELSGLRYLRRLWTSIDGVVRLRTARMRQRMRVEGVDKARIVDPSLEHRELVAALRARRPGAAGKAARRHIETALKRIQAEARE
jgi:DNA-binding GntR family transcriptional regulator